MTRWAASSVLLQVLFFCCFFQKVQMGAQRDRRNLTFVTHLLLNCLFTSVTVRNSVYWWGRQGHVCWWCWQQQINNVPLLEKKRIFTPRCLQAGMREPRWERSSLQDQLLTSMDQIPNRTSDQKHDLNQARSLNSLHPEQTLTGHWMRSSMASLLPGAQWLKHPAALRAPESNRLQEA